MQGIILKSDSIFRCDYRLLFNLFGLFTTADLQSNTDKNNNQCYYFKSVSRSIHEKICERERQSD